MFVGRVDDVLIDFICDDVGVILLCEVCDKLPQVTTISLLGSTGWPINRVCFAASASRKFCAPQVMEYW